ncbi:hypothetical protein ABV979_000117 [Campylobacter jejuni]
MSKLKNTIINDLRNEILKICKELSSTKDAAKKEKLIKNLALLNDIEMTIYEGEAYENNQNINVKVELSDKNAYFLEYCKVSKIFKLSICL